MSCHNIEKSVNGGDGKSTEYCTVEGDDNSFISETKMYGYCTREQLLGPGDCSTTIRSKITTDRSATTYSLESATARALKEVIYGGAEISCEKYTQRIYGYGKGGILTGTATFYTDVSGQVCVKKAK